MSAHKRLIAKLARAFVVGAAITLTTANAAERTLSAKPMRVLTGFNVPESVCLDAQTGQLYVSNVATETRGFWQTDGRAWISRLRPDASLDALKWRRSSERFTFDAPKGMCVVGRELYVADITRVRVFPLDGQPGQPRTIEVPGAKMHNDMATDGRYAFVSDTANARVVRLDTSGRGSHVFIPAPQGVNGITFHRGKLFTVSWAQHDLYELDPIGESAPQAFGLASHFTALDGIEVLDDGTFIVSDFPDGKVCAISPDRKRVRTLVEVECPADIEVDRRNMRLFIPQFNLGRVLVYKLVAN